MSAGSHAYSEGVEYHEHHGTEVKLLFGQEMACYVGSETKTIIGMESSVNLGAVADIGMVTKVELQFGAVMEWVKGWDFVMAEHGGGVFDAGFCATAGSDNPTAFKTLKTYLTLIVAAQALATAASVALIKTIFAPHKNSEGEIVIEGNSGFFASVTVGGQLLTLTTAILTIALNSIIKKQSSLTPISAVTIHKTGYAFLGVSATQAAAIPATGSAGLALSPQSFKLSWDRSQREFDDQGHGVVGYKTDGETSIVGNDLGVQMDAKSIGLKTNSDKKNAATNRMAVLELAPTLGYAKLQSKKGSTASSEITLSDAGSFISASSATASAMLTFEPNTVEISTSAPVANTKLSMSDGTASLESLSSSAKVSLSASEAVLSFGTNKVSIDTSGVTIANGSVTILSPTAPLPDVAAITEIANQAAKKKATEIGQETDRKLKELKADLEETVMGEVSTVLMKVDEKLRTVSTMKGATGT